jgi:hypothetical protein
MEREHRLVGRPSLECRNFQHHNRTRGVVEDLTVGDATAQITWPTNFADYVLETATNLPALEWGVVADTVTIVGERFAVTVDIRAPNQFYRLRTR